MAITKGPDDSKGADWHSLLERSSVNPLFRGSVIRCPGQWPYENIVDFMVVRNFEEDAGMTLIVASGYKAGHILIILPKESETGHDDASDYVGVEWLKANWAKWVYPECGVEDVYVCDHYPAPASLPLDGPDQSHRGDTRKLEL